MSARQRFMTRSIRLVGQMQIDTAKALLDNVPRDPVKPLQLVIREEPTTRTRDANARMWAGPLKDIATQAWIEGRQYSDVVLHEHFKEEFLPDPDVITGEELARRVRDPETYRKWDTDPKGKRRCVGSTTELTPFGFGEYLEQVCAFGAGLGVQFSVSPRELERQP